MNDVCSTNKATPFKTFGFRGANVNFTSHNIYYVNNFNISEYVTSDGTVAAHYEYDAFGNTTLADGPMATAFPFRYSTKYTDPESGFSYYGFRYLDYLTGRWLSRDVLGESGGLMLYGFVNNNSVDYWDLLGLTSCGCDEKEINKLAASLATSAAMLSLRNPVYYEDDTKKVDPYYLEYCGRICCNPKTLEVYFRGPVKGHFRHKDEIKEDDYNREPGGTPTCGEAFNNDKSIKCDKNEGDLAVLDVHIHHDKGEKSCFSPGDLGWPKQTCRPLVLKNTNPKSPVVMCCPDGKCYEIDPKTGVKTEITCPQREIL